MQIIHVDRIITVVKRIFCNIKDKWKVVAYYKTVVKNDNTVFDIISAQCA